MDGLGQAPEVTEPVDAVATTTAISNVASLALPPLPPLPSIVSTAVVAPSASPVPPHSLGLTGANDRPVTVANEGTQHEEVPASTTSIPSALLDPALQDIPSTITDGPPLPLPSSTATDDLTQSASGTLNADAVNEAGEAEHRARVDHEVKVEQAILAADRIKHEEVQEQQQQHEQSMAVALPVTTNHQQQEHQQNNAIPILHQPIDNTPPSPSSTSALSSVTASAAPSIIQARRSRTDLDESGGGGNEDEEDSQSQLATPTTDADSDRKPRSSTTTTTGGRNTARRAASIANLKDSAVAAGASTSTSSRRSEKPNSTSSASGATNGNGTASGSNSRTRGTSAQGQQRQSSRSSKNNGNGSSNTRPRFRQRAGSPSDTNKDGNDTTPGTRRSRRTRQSTTHNGGGSARGGDEDASEDADEGFTRCVCGNNDDETPAFMIQCETCKAWQHGPCVGFKYENDCPDTYYCEQCRPDLHPNLTSRGKKHARSASASSKANRDEHEEHKEHKDSIHHHHHLSKSLPSSATTATHKPTSRDHRELSTGSLPATATSSGHPSYHRARSSADAAIISSFLEQPHVHSARSQSATVRSISPASPGSPGSGPGSSDGSRRPMYPSTSHFAAPQNPKRRSTMNSRDSAAFDESILLATQAAIRESRAMAKTGGSGGSEGRKRKKRDGDDDMEPVKEEEEDYSDDVADRNELGQSDRANSHSKREESAAQHAADSATDTNDREEEREGDEEGEGEGEDGDPVLDANGDAAPRKRRRRRGAGALFTAPNKKRAASARFKKVVTDGTDTTGLEEPPLSAALTESQASAAEDDINARKRKRDDEPELDERKGRGTSPAPSQDTSMSSHSSDKPLAQANKRRKASPAAQDGSATMESAAAESSQTGEAVSLILDSTLQVTTLPLSAEESNAPSPAVSVSASQIDTSEAAKNEQHAQAVTNGLLSLEDKGKKAADQDQEIDGSTPAPAAQADDSASANANGRNLKQPNQYTYKRGGPGSRGGLKGSPSKRAALAAAAEARHGKHRDDTPSTYEDWINQPPSWGIPDHLSHLSHLLPAQSPLPLQVPKYASSPTNSAVPSPVTPQVEITAPDDTANGSTTPIPIITVSSSLEPSAKIRFPSRRMSIPEMRKRAKSMLDYLSRVQVDTIDRSNRNRALASIQEGILHQDSPAEEMPVTPPASMLFKTDNVMTPQSAAMMDELSRQLNSFQEKFL